MTALPRLIPVLLLLAGALLARPAAAAESYDNCTNFIDSLPATISTQGTWCLREHLGTNIATGNAISVNVNNVTIDCNGFKIGGLAAGDSSLAVGIYSFDNQNTTVRNCNVRGFSYGILMQGGAGHLIEDNRLDNNLYRGIDVVGSNNRILRNVVYDTGGGTSLAPSVYGIRASGSITGNTVSGLFATTSDNAQLFGISAHGADTWVRGNLVSSFSLMPNVPARGIELMNSYQRVSGNHVISGEDVSGANPTAGIFTSGANPAFCLDNTVAGFNTNIDGDCTGYGNVTP